MKALRLDRPAPGADAPLVAVDLPEPVPGPGEILLEVDACAVCRTDLHLVDGEVSARRPVVPGHQVVGVVAEGSDPAGPYRVGERVGVGWVSATCGACRFCVTDRENLCERAVFTGRDRDGGYAERMTAPAGAAFRLPEDLPPERAAPLLCAGVIGYRTLRLSGARPGGRLGLFGFGASAHLVLRVALSEGSVVFVFTRSPAARERALAAGAAWAGEPDADPGILLDAAASFAPAGEVVPQALARMDRGATLAVNAIHTTPIPLLPWEMLSGERVVRSVTNFTRRDAEEFLEVARRIGLTPEVSIYPLERANEALAAARAGAVPGSAVLRPSR